ncbi:DUF6473 family protein [Pelagovum sp. HNIBRBA483]|uniref:DUF6473 family protein n=1 Tax=Pelagovum sp. HNIBRBA483 TaxID=3233341 RepID=UPI0034A47136
MEHVALDRFVQMKDLGIFGRTRLELREGLSATENYLVCLGGSQTYGREIERPVTAHLSAATGMTVANFGVRNAGWDAFMREASVLEAASSARICLIQIVGAQNTSNRFYRVHPRRNDRLVAPSTVLSALYSEVDFSEFTFTRHLLGALYSVSYERFETVVEELRQAWVARLRALIREIEAPVLLYWLSDRPLSDQPWDLLRDPMSRDPLFVTRSMVQAVAHHADGFVEIAPPVGKPRLKRPFLSLRDSSVPGEDLDEAAHSAAADALLPEIEALLEKKKARQDDGPSELQIDDQIKASR